MKKKTADFIKELKLSVNALKKIAELKDLELLTDELDLWINQVHPSEEENKECHFFQNKDENSQKLLMIYFLRKINLYLNYLINNRDRDIDLQEVSDLKEKVDQYLAIN